MALKKNLPVVQGPINTSLDGQAKAFSDQELYAQFIKEAANLCVDSPDETLENPAALIGMYSLVGRIRLMAGDQVLLAAEKVAASIVDSYNRPPATFDDAYKLARESQVDPLKELTEACREERKLTLMNL